MATTAESAPAPASSSAPLPRAPVVRARSLALGAGVVFYRLLLDLAYRTIVAPSYEHQGFQNHPTLQALVVSWLILCALLPLVVRVLRTETLSAQITSLLVLISLVPTTTLIAHDPRYSSVYAGLVFVYWLVFLLACAFLPAVKPFRRPVRSEWPHVIVLVITAATVMYISWRFTGFRIHVGLLDVYELRAEAREYQVATVVGYFATVADNVLPILLAFYLRRRWYVVAGAVAIVILFNFGISATKQVLFLLLFALASVALRGPARFNPKVLAALTALLLLCMVEQSAVGSIFLTEFSLYRVMILPAHLHWVHFDFFQSNELLYLTQSALKFFFESPYEENIQFLLGDYFIGQFTARANNGLFSDGYMNFGAASVLIYPVLVVFLLKLIEGASEGLSSSVHFMLLVALSFVFLGLPLPTAFLSAGLGVLVVLLSTLPRQAQT